MILLDRRRAVLGTLAAGAALALPGRVLAQGQPPRLFVYDGRIAPARAAAARWQAAGVQVLDREDIDLGHAWRSRIPAALPQGSGAIVGLTGWIDSFICEVFGREQGLRMHRDSLQPGAVLHGWTLAPAPAG